MTIHTGSGAVIDFDVSQSTWFITAYTVVLQLVKVTSVVSTLTLINICCPTSHVRDSEFFYELSDTIGTIITFTTDCVLLCDDLNCPRDSSTEVDVRLVDIFNCISSSVHEYQTLIFHMLFLLLLVIVMLLTALGWHDQCQLLYHKWWSWWNTQSSEACCCTGDSQLGSV